MGHGLYHWHWGIESWTIGNQHGSEWWVVGGWHLIALFVFHLNIKNILVEKKINWFWCKCKYYDCDSFVF